MFPFRKFRARRAEIRKNRPDLPSIWIRQMLRREVIVSLAIAAAFWAACVWVTMLRESVVRYRPGQFAAQNVLSRVSFSFVDKAKLLQERQTARDQTWRVYRSTNVDPWPAIREELLSLPERLANKRRVEEVPTALQQKLELSTGDLSEFARYPGPEYRQDVAMYLARLQEVFKDRPGGLILLPGEQRREDLERWITVLKLGPVRTSTATYSPDDPEFEKILVDNAKHFRLLAYKIGRFVAKTIQPTHALDPEATLEAQNAAAEQIGRSQATLEFKENQILVARGSVLSERDWEVLRAEQAAFIHSLGWRALKPKLGLAGIALLATIGLSIYVARYQPRVIRNHARALALAVLLFMMLLLAELAAVGRGPLFVFGVAPTLLTAMILVIAYDQRFAQGVSTMHALLVTAALDQSIGFFVILWTGVITCCWLLHDVRSRSKLIEVGGLTALAMAAATAAAGAIAYDPLPLIYKNCLTVASAGLGVGFVVLGILPFVERIFRITTSMSLLELADASQPLLRRLQVEAPGTYNHSLQVATLSEAAAEAIGAHGLLCRVGAYYHDIGKMNKSEYFRENQMDGQNRHLNLTPNVSLLIILGHVKDGVELAKEYKLPTVLIPFIQQHHGTTLVEYFYHQAVNQRDPSSSDPDQEISETHYRYPGPRPRSKEVAIVMMADVVESSTRAMVDPTPARVEALVHDVIMKRLTDKQFGDCPLTLKEIETVEKAMIKTLLGIHHGRMAYPSTMALTHGTAASAETSPAAKTA